jgi:predicted permease
VRSSSRAPSLALRAALALVAASAPLVPAPLRSRWRRQWQGDLWYQATAAPAGGPARSLLSLLSRALGAPAHAATLRARQWRSTMLLHDLRAAWRTFGREPWFAVIATLTLALGTGANTTVFSWIDALAFDPIPAVARDRELVSLQFAQGSRDDLSFSYPNYVDVRDAAAAEFAGIAAYDLVALNVRLDDEPERVWGEIATANLFEVLGVQPAHGRLLQPADDRAPGAAPVVVISHGFWQRRLSGDPAAVGRVVQINGRPFTIVGVAPPGFIGPMNGLAADMWLPMMMQRDVTPGDRLQARGSGWLQAFGRLAPGVTRAQAQAALDVVAARLAQAHPELNGQRRLVVTPIWRDGVGAVLLPVLGVVLGVTVVVLLIACANVAGLLLARAGRRQREMAVRLAIGASRGQLVRQLLAESAVLAAAGGAAALVVTIWTSRLLAAALPPLPFPVQVGGDVNWRVFLFAIAVSSITALVFGLVPALAASRPAVAPLLKDTAGASGGGHRRARLRQLLVISQVALAVVLLTGAGLFLRTLQHASRIDPGFDLRSGIFARFDVQAAALDDTSGPLFYRDLLRAVRSVPGATDATLSTFVPLTVGGSSDTSVEIEGYARPPREEMTIYYSMVAPRYFETLGLPIVGGRSFTEQDAGPAPLAVIVNETMAQRYWADGQAIGKRLNYGSGWATIVGVARDGKYNAVNEPPANFMYLPIYQAFRSDAALLVRTAVAPEAVVDDVRTTVRRINPNLPLFDVMTVDEHLRGAVLLPRIAAWLLGLFGAIALGLATIGLYGVLAYIASQRTQEIGIRMAIGADRAIILRQFLGHGLRLALAGIAIGTALAALAMPLLESQLVGVAATDPLAYGGTMIALAGAAALASYLPARRAARIDPLRALRQG